MSTLQVLRATEKMKTTGKLKAVAKKYETNDSFRSKRKASSKESYPSSPTKKARKKDAIQNQRIAKRTRLDNQEEVVRKFTQKAKQCIDYSCVAVIDSYFKIKFKSVNGLTMLRMNRQQMLQT